MCSKSQEYTQYIDIINHTNYKKSLMRNNYQISVALLYAHYRVMHHLSAATNSQPVFLLNTFIAVYIKMRLKQKINITFRT